MYPNPVAHRKFTVQRNVRSRSSSQASTGEKSDRFVSPRDSYSADSVRTLYATFTYGFISVRCFRVQYRNVITRVYDSIFEYSVRNDIYIYQSLPPYRRTRVFYSSRTKSFRADIPLTKINARRKMHRLLFVFTAFGEYRSMC